LGARKLRELYLRQHGTAASESSFKRVLERAGLTNRVGAGNRRLRLAGCGARAAARRPTSVDGGLQGLVV